jgi:hypothetical protein
MNLVQSRLSKYPNARVSTIMHLIKVEKMAARLKAEYLAAEERRVEKAVAACLRTFHINCWRAEKAGKL